MNSRGIGAGWDPVEVHIRSQLVDARCVDFHGATEVSVQVGYCCVVAALRIEVAHEVLGQRVVHVVGGSIVEFPGLEANLRILEASCEFWDGRNVELTQAILALSLRYISIFSLTSRSSVRASNTSASAKFE